MFKKSQCLSFSSNNTTFEEVYNLLRYQSSSTKMVNLTLTEITSQERIYFTGERQVKVPFADRLGSMAPEEIKISINGYIGRDNCAKISYNLPKEYSQYLVGQEEIKITPQDDKIHIHLKLKYSVVESKEPMSMLETIKAKAYSSMVNTIESNFLTLYTSKRGIVFNRPCSESIKTLEEFQALMEK